MMGLICYRDAGEKNGTRMLCGVNFCAVYVTRGEGVLAHYLYVPDEASADIKGLAIVGGVVSVPVSGTAKVNAKFVMANGQLVDIDPANQVKYALTGAPSGTSVSTDGVITAGATAGSNGEITVTYPATGAAQFTCTANLAVVSG